MLNDVRKLKDTVTEQDTPTAYWKHKEELYRFLKLYTGEQLHRSLECVKHDNGFEAWRQLDVQCEPSVGVREASVMQAFTSLSNVRARNLKETRSKMLALEERAK